ncbi:hypothetical protein J7L00_03520 [Candidatus Bathyarchaeota archaeon]|nr:hypothetical protein [Candidatus Bathyarchaeota archaeon]
MGKNVQNDDRKRKGQLTLDGELAVKALEKMRRVLMRKESPAPKIHRRPDDPYFQEIRRLAWETVTEWFAEKACPIPRDTLINLVFQKIKGMRLRGEWDYPIPRYDTVRRRINELLEEQYVGSPPPCIAIPATILDRETTIYLPNPARVHPSKRKQIMEILDDWRWAGKLKRARGR